jgi:beta-phosphoglucomutase-like phosphatase (HAD superfamily)
MIKAFIFDMDGTLMDSDILWVKAIHKYLIDNNCNIAEDEAMDMAYGKSWHSIYENITKRFPKLNIDINTMDTAIYLLFAQLRDTADIRIAESVDLLKQLAKDYPVSIVSGAGRRDIEECIEIINAENILSFYLGSEDYLNGKPAPDCFLMAAEKFGVQPSECLVFEDSTAGVNAAKAAGMYCVALVRQQSPVQNVSNADLILDDLSKFDLKTIEESNYTNA